MRKELKKWLLGVAQEVLVEKPLWSNKTHTVYPESTVDVDGSWSIRFYDYEGSGVVALELSGKEPTPAEAHVVVQNRTKENLDRFVRV